MNILSTLLLWSWLIAYWQGGQRPKAIAMNFLSTLLLWSWLIAAGKTGGGAKKRSGHGAEPNRSRLLYVNHLAPARVA